eukprot:1024010-Prorocentrum_minimum.AAC.4
MSAICTIVCHLIGRRIGALWDGMYVRDMYDCMSFVTSSVLLRLRQVNFPNANLPYTKNAGVAARLCIVNKNEPGVLGTVASFLGGKNINIVQQLNASRGKVRHPSSTFAHPQSRQ